VLSKYPKYTFRLTIQNKQVQPALTPPSINIAKHINVTEPNTNHKLQAFNLGNIISEEHTSKGIRKLPNPPINIGIIIKNIINNP
jgi:hypothetical protein